MAVLFRNVKSIYPKPLDSSWDDLRGLLSFHEENAVKDAGALWSPVEYDLGTTRGNRNVRFVEALVVDMDGEAFDHARLDGLEWFAYSTYSHRLDDPHITVTSSSASVILNRRPQSTRHLVRVFLMERQQLFELFPRRSQWLRINRLHILKQNCHNPSS